MRQNNTTGKSAKPVQCSLRKYSAFAVGQISDFNWRVSPDERGVRTSRTRGEMRWTRRWRRRAQAARVRRSRVVLTPRCWRQLGGKCPAGDGGKRAVHRGEHEVSRKATAQGRPGCSACTCMLVCAFLVRNCTRDRGCSVHPVFPAPSIFEGANEVANLGRRRREIAKLYPRHCERSEAIHVYTCGAMDCFAVLAMTARAATYRCRCAR